MQITKLRRKTTEIIKNFFKRFIDEIIISMKLPFRISVKSIPKITNRTPKGMLNMKKRLKKATNKKAK